MEINDTKFPSNSHDKKSFKDETTEVKKKEPPKQIAKAIRTKKPSLAKRMQETFLAEDIHDVKHYIFRDIVVPSIIDSIIDVVQSGIEMVFGVGGSRRNRRSRSSNKSYTNYSSISYKKDDRDERQYRRLRTDGRFNVEEVIVETRGEAEEIIHNLADLCEDYGWARVSDLYAMVGITPEFTAERWGWDTVASARPVHQRGGGYLIDLPRPIYIE